MKSKIKSGFAFHCHHNVLFEWVFDYQERVDCIKAEKPIEEQELRLKLFQMIPDDKIPKELYKAWEAYYKAREAYYKHGKLTKREAYYKAWEAYDKTREEAYKLQMIELHKELCPDCPWDGKTIFPKE